MKEYKISVKGNNKFFVTLGSLADARKTARENAKINDVVMEIREKRGSRFYLIETITK